MVQLKQAIQQNNYDKVVLIRFIVNLVINFTVIDKKGCSLITFRKKWGRVFEI